MKTSLDRGETGLYIRASHYLRLVNSHLDSSNTSTKMYHLLRLSNKSIPVYYEQCVRRPLECITPKLRRHASAWPPCFTQWGSMKKQRSLKRLSPSYEQWGDKTNAITEPRTNSHFVSWKDYHDLTDEQAAHIFQTTVRVARLIRAVSGCEGLNLVQSNGTVGQQDVFHFHLHLVPRIR